MLIKRTAKVLVASAFFLAAALSFAATNDRLIVVDLLKIAGKSEADVAEYLGEPVACKESKYGVQCSYDLGETEIVFINGLADWITIEGIDHIAFDESAIQTLGLAGKKPDFENNFSMRWDAIGQIMEITIFKGASEADYAYVKTKTK